MLPISKDLSATTLAYKATKYLTATNLKRVPTHQQLVKFISDRRHDANPIAQSATHLDNLVLTDALKKTESGKLFLLYDNGVEAKEDRMIAYATQENIEKLGEATTWLCDGTFSTCPRLFKQLWVLHGQFEDKAIPLVYFLLSGFSTEVYQEAFTIVRDALAELPSKKPIPATHATRGKPAEEEKDEETLAAEKEEWLSSLGPKVIIMDYEQAQYNAFKNTFDGEVQGCFFHFRQAVYRNMYSKPDLYNKFLNDGSGKIRFRIAQFAALAFVKSDHVSQGFVALLYDPYMVAHEPLFKDFINYFERQ